MHFGKGGVQSAAMTEPQKGNNRPGYILTIIVALVAALTLFLMQRPPICTCGHVDLWHGGLDSGNSQHIADWYSLSHVIHGFLFYALTRLALRRQPKGVRLAVAVAIESAWEILENSPFIIDRYRTATIALGYSGDSILNSMSDIGMMSLGFAIAARAPVWLTVTLAVALELLALAVIRDNLTLNILMLTYPVDAIRDWQAAL